MKRRNSSNMSEERFQISSLPIMTSSVILLRGCKNSWLKIWSTPKSSAQSKEFRDAGKDTSPNGIGGTKFSVKSTPLE